MRNRSKRALQAVAAALQKWMKEGRPGLTLPPTRAHPPAQPSNRTNVAPRINATPRTAAPRTFAMRVADTPQTPLQPSWAQRAAAVHDTIRPKWRIHSLSGFVSFVGHQVVTAIKWICANRENGTGEMRMAGHWLEEWLRRAAEAEQDIPEPLKACVVDICQWANSVRLGRPVNVGVTVLSN